ncbi:MAG: hypothetical protein EXR71_11850 [Myxococcales bacterium]|nr:hypothetical protein [Myxococcales bacterium]
MFLVMFLSCDPTGTDESQDTAGSGALPVTDYDVHFSTEPHPIVAGESATFRYQIVDQLARPIEDLQTSHERMSHVQFVSRDLTSFQHRHHEDYQLFTADNLRNASFEFPLTVPLAGEYLVVFDYAHRNQYLSTVGALVAGGGPAQADAPVLTPNDVASDRDVTGTLTWDAPAVPGFEASWNIHLTDASGAEITDLVPYLGADAHAFLATSTLDFSAHTHAWFPGMENVAPGHPMPTVYVGPDLPFHYVLPTPGFYRMWIQFTRESEPTTAVVLVFTVLVEG